MGLRERQAAQTRELILDAAFSLFLDRGYEHTTMEEIATTAEIGTTTLYRYYPTKDLLVVGPLELNGQMAKEFRSRSTDEPLETSLGHAVRALLATPRADATRLSQIREVLDATPSLGARLYEQFVNERTLLERALAERLGRPADDLYCKATARVTTMVLELVSEVSPVRQVGGGRAVMEDAMEQMRSIMQQLDSEPPTFPRL